MGRLKEEQLVKALSEMEAIAKGAEGSSKIPRTTAEANGGFSDEGDKQELATSSSEGGDRAADLAVAKAAKRQRMEEEESSEDESSEDAEKALGSDDDSEDSEDAEESEESEEMTEKCAKKGSIADLIKSDTHAGPVVDVSPFIERLVNEVSDAELELRKSLVGFKKDQAVHNRAMQKAMVAMGNVILEVKKSIGELQGQPAGMRKSILSKSEIQERFEEDRPDFSKNQVLDAMCELVMKGRVNAVDVSRYEATNTMEPNVRSTVESHLRAGS